MSSPEMISIPITEYLSLISHRDFLMALENAGVDNWEGYSEVWRRMEAEDPTAESLDK